MPPKVLILMATFNGSRWLDDQLRSIADQQSVGPRLVVSDDQSTDSTADVLLAWSDQIDMDILPPCPGRFGNANRNFMRLVRDAPLKDSDFVCFADQDDVWMNEKLARAVSRLEDAKAEAYSSDVTAFWEDGRERRIVKSQAQQTLDHVFESAGPGCTFVFTREAFMSLREWVIARANDLSEVRVHDWAIYAFGRESGWTWVIDDFSGVQYRQHASNEIGANVGLKSAVRRLAYLVSGRYRDDVLRIAHVADHQSRIIDRVKRLGLGDRLSLMLQARRLRRKWADVLVVALTFLTMARTDGVSRGKRRG